MCRLAKAKARFFFFPLCLKRGIKSLRVAFLLTVWGESLLKSQNGLWTLVH